MWTGFPFAMARSIPAVATVLAGRLNAINISTFLGSSKDPTTRMIHVILEVGRLTGIIATVPGVMLQAGDPVR